MTKLTYAIVGVDTPLAHCEQRGVELAFPCVGFCVVACARWLNLSGNLLTGAVPDALSMLTGLRSAIVSIRVGWALRSSLATP